MLDVLELKHLFLIVHIIEKEFIFVVSLRFNVGIVFLTSDLMEATRAENDRIPKPSPKARVFQPSA